MIQVNVLNQTHMFYNASIFSYSYYSPTLKFSNGVVEIYSQLTKLLTFIGWKIQPELTIGLAKSGIANLKGDEQQAIHISFLKLDVFCIQYVSYD
jgi:hypothetical protein